MLVACGLVREVENVTFTSLVLGNNHVFYLHAHSRGGSGKEAEAAFSFVWAVDTWWGHESLTIAAPWR